MSLKDSSISESRDAEFFEHVFPLKQSVSGNISVSTNVGSGPLSLPSSSSIENDNVDEPRKNKRRRIEKDFGSDFITAFLMGNSDKITERIVSAYLIGEDPKTYKEAITSLDASFWKEAVKCELDSILLNHTWELVELPKGCKPIKCKWIFKKKLRPDGTIDKFKARLVAVGYAQKKYLYSIFFSRLNNLVVIFWFMFSHTFN